MSSVELSHYRISKIREQDLALVKNYPVGLQPGSAMGSGQARDKQEEYLSQIIQRLNELFVTDKLSENDLLSYARTIRDKVSENHSVMHQLANNAPEQAFLGDFPAAMDEAVMSSGDAHQNQMMQYLNSKELATGFQRLVFDMLLTASKAPPK